MSEANGSGTGGVEPGGGVRLVFVTCPDRSTAESIARTLVEERLAACGNAIDGLVSIYRWKGAVETDAECLLLLKTRAGLLEALSERLHALHPYDVPELLAVEVDRGAPAYLRWVVEETGGGP